MIDDDAAADGGGEGDGDDGGDAQEVHQLLDIQTPDRPPQRLLLVLIGKTNPGGGGLASYGCGTLPTAGPLYTFPAPRNVRLSLMRSSD